MGGNFGKGNHDPRLIDLIAMFALLVIIGTAYEVYVGAPEQPLTTAFIVPSQSTHW